MRPFGKIWPRGRWLILAALLGGLIGVLPIAGGLAATPTVSAIEEGGYAGYPKFKWSPSQVEAASNGSVTFQNMSETVHHGIVWQSTPATPTCDAGVPVYSTVTGEGKANWKGTCTFSQAGNYTFYCSVHGAEMVGTVTVAANGTTTTTTTASPLPTTTTSTPPSAPEPPLGVLKLAKTQRGGSVKGSVNVSNTGDRLEIDVFATTAFLAKAKHGGRIRVGRLVRSSVASGTVSFAVNLDSKARRALKRRHRVSLTIKVTLTPPYGAALTITRSVVQHG